MHVARMADRGNEQKILPLRLKESDSLRELNIECHMLLGLNSGHGKVTGSCEHGNEISGFLKPPREFFHPLSCCWILKNESH